MNLRPAAPQIEEPLVSFASEQATLGAAITSPSAPPTVMSDLRPLDFGLPAHRMIFYAMLELSREKVPVDLLTLADRLRLRNTLADVGGEPYLVALVESCPVVSHVGHYISEIERASEIRTVKTELRRIDSLPGNDLEKGEITGKVEELLRYIRSQQRVTDNGIYSLADRKGVEFPPVRWAIENVIAQGLTILAGKPKQGKSWFTLQGALAVARGDNAYGLVPTTEGKVLYLALEDTEPRMLGRVSDLLDESLWPGNFYCAYDWPRMGEGGIEQLAAWFIRNPDTKLVIIDTFAKIRPIADARANAYDEDYRAVSELKAIADLHGASIVLVHHQRKMSATDWLDSISGTMGISGAADGLIGFFRERGANTAEIKVTGRDINEGDYALEWQAPGWVLVGDAAEYGATQAQESILAILRAHNGPMAYRDLRQAVCEKTGIKPTAAGMRISRIVEAEKVARSGGVYWLPSSQTVAPVSEEGSASRGSVSGLPLETMLPVTNVPVVDNDKHSPNHGNNPNSTNAKVVDELKPERTWIMWKGEDSGFPRLEVSEATLIPEGRKGWSAFCSKATSVQLSEVRQHLS